MEVQKQHTDNNSATIEIDDGHESPERQSSTRWSILIKASLFLLLLAFIIFVIIDARNEQYVKQISQAFLEWVEDNPVAGIFSFIGVYFFATGRSCYEQPRQFVCTVCFFFTRTPNINFWRLTHLIRTASHC